MAKKKQEKSTYLENAAKMCLYPVNIQDKFISVPTTDQDTWHNCLTALHLNKQHGFAIQLTITDAAPLNDKIFNPELKLKNHRPTPKEKPQEGFKVGDKFEIVSSKDRLEIVSNLNGLKLHYLNVGKADINTTIVALEKQLNMETWRRIL